MEIKKLFKNMWRMPVDLLNELAGRRNSQGPRIKSTSKYIEELHARKNQISTPAPPETPAKPEQKILKISSQQDFDAYKLKLQDLTALKNFVDRQGDKFKWFKVDKIEADVNNFAPPEFDNYATSKVVDNVVKIAKRFMGALDSCEREIKNPQKDSSAAVELKNLIEKYLQGVGIFTLDFKVDDDYSDWADLGMDEEIFIVPAGERRLHNKLKDIFVLPHYIDFENELGEQDRRVFGGSCAVYVFGA